MKEFTAVTGQIMKIFFTKADRKHTTASDTNAKNASQKKFNKRTASQAFDGNSKKSFMDQKATRKQRCAQKPHYEMVTRAKQLWNSLRERKIDKSRRSKLASDLYEVVKNNIYQISAKHDASRVIQGLFRHGTREHRDQIVLELKEHIVELAKTQYGSFLIKKMLKYGSENDRAAIAKALTGQAIVIGTHNVAASVLETAQEYLSTSLFWKLRLEFYGKEFAYFPADIKDRNLNGLIETYPDKKIAIVKHLGGILNRMIDKELLSLVFVQTLLWDYFTHAEYSDVVGIVPNVRDFSSALLATYKGACVVNRCLGFGTTKDRKRILKCVKDKVLEATNHPSGYLVIQRILDVVDDTVLVQKSILSELNDHLFEVAMHPTGKKVILQLLSPLNPKYLSPDEISLLAPPMIPNSDKASDDSSVVNYKKDPATKRETYLRGWLPKLQKLCCDQMQALMCSKNGRDVLIEVIKESIHQNSENLEELKSVFSQTAKLDNVKDEQYDGLLYSHPIAHYTLRRVFKETSFALFFLESNSSQLADWAVANNRGAFVVLSCLENEEHGKKAKKVLGKILRPSMPKLKEAAREISGYIIVAPLVHSLKVLESDSMRLGNALALTTYYLLITVLAPHAFACTLIVCGKKATVDGSTLVAHTDDAGGMASDVRLVRIPAQHHSADSRRAVYKFAAGYPRLVAHDRGPHYEPKELNPSNSTAPKTYEKVFVPMGYISQVLYTYGYYDQDYGIMNDVQLSIGESTCGARTVGWPKDLPYGYNLFGINELSKIALERCDSARCAIQTMGSLAEEHGFYSEDSGDPDAPGYVDSAETLGISDKYGEVWIFHILTGKNNASAVWAAQRVADDHITVVANGFTIREIDLDKPDYYLASKNIFSFCEEMGWWNKSLGEPFDFTRVYGYQAKDDGITEYVGRRVWRVYDLLAPSLKLDPHLGWQETYPFSVKPDALVSANDVMDVYRDYYQGTPYDMTKGFAAGPFGSPVRWHTNSKIGRWERTISIYRAVFSYVLQIRPSFPDVAGGVIWYGQDCPHGTVYVPFSCRQENVPESYLTGKQSEFSVKSAWRAFNFVNNWSILRFDVISQDVRKRIKELQDEAFELQRNLDKHNFGSEINSTELAILEQAKNAFASHVVEEWWNFAWTLIAKYSDGNILTGENPGDCQSPGYPTWWLKMTNFVKPIASTLDGSHAKNAVAKTTASGPSGRQSGSSFSVLQFGGGMIAGLVLGMCVLALLNLSRRHAYQSPIVRLLIAMLFLETEHKVVKEVLEEKLGDDAPRPIEPLQVRLCDFDDAQYELLIENNTLTVSLMYTPYKDIEEFGVKHMFPGKYAEFSIVAAKEGFDLSLQIDVNAINSENSASIIHRLAVLKRNILGAPFEQCFQALKAGNAASLGAIQIPFRQYESIYILPQLDRVVVVFSVLFEDKTDQAIARVFLQELVDSRRAVNNAPPVAFNKDPPLELRGASGVHAGKGLVGYLSFAIFPEHVNTIEKCEKAATMLQGFRNYLHYHIKCSKTYLHIRMRKRVDLLLQVLNRSRPERDPAKITKKTITGRTFLHQNHSSFAALAVNTALALTVASQQREQQHPVVWKPRLPCVSGAQLAAAETTGSLVSKNGARAQRLLEDVFQFPSKEYHPIKRSHNAPATKELLRHSTASLSSDDRRFLDSPFTANDFYWLSSRPRPTKPQAMMAYPSNTTNSSSPSGRAFSSYTDSKVSGFFALFGFEASLHTISKMEKLVRCVQATPRFSIEEKTYKSHREDHERGAGHLKPACFSLTKIDNSELDKLPSSPRTASPLSLYALRNLLSFVLIEILSVKARLHFISLYDTKDIYNMDDNAYFYCPIPGKTISKNRIPGHKKIKKRLTVAVTSIADGSTKSPLLFVGTARHLRCFGGKSVEELGIQYAIAAKGWMNAELFTSWIERFNERMKSEGHHVLLLLDNASYHRVNLPLLNVTSFKSKSEQLKTRHIVGMFDELLDKAAEVGNENIETQIESLYTLDVLQAMQSAQEAWEIVMCTTVANCWRHTKMIDDEVYELVESIKQLALGQQPHHTADECTHSYSALLIFYNQYLYLSKYLLYLIYFYTFFCDGILKEICSEIANKH
uniref:Peptidase putative n=1 Tax=Albugo laibachii Nc14 TaxID=890382 RepID=F0W4C8_9STRA|nr:peptidase putative [Albugo laibachii Nc14]|eukprot:CCA15961.1 peptidase putative [Albugo laibachii Nc14]